VLNFIISLVLNEKDIHLYTHMTSSIFAYLEIKHRIKSEIIKKQENAFR